LSKQNKRNQIDIILKILDLCTEPIIQTHLMYKGNLSFLQLKYYLDYLQIRELIITTKSIIEHGITIETYRSYEKTTITTTDKGRQLLNLLSMKVIAT
jgi:predicted transcriptional regulator